MRQTHFRAVALLSIFAGQGLGCSFALIDKPPANHRDLNDFDCSTKKGWPITDTVIGGVSALAAIGSGFDDGLRENPDGTREPTRSMAQRIGTSAVAAVLAAAFGASAYGGFKDVRQCREARRDLMARRPPNPTFNPALTGWGGWPPPPAPPPVWSPSNPGVQVPTPEATNDAGRPVARRPDPGPGVLVEVGQTVEREVPSPVGVDGATASAKYKVIRLDAKHADVYMRALLHHSGTALLGNPEGDAVKVRFPDGRCGPGWAGRDGSLQAVVHTQLTEQVNRLRDPCVAPNYSPSAADRLFEMRNGRWFEVKPSFQVESPKRKGAEKVKAKVTIAKLDATDLLASTRTFMAHMGIALPGKQPQRVRTQLENGQAGVGTLDARGRLTEESSDGWKPRESTPAEADPPPSPPLPVSRPLPAEVSPTLAREPSSAGARPKSTPVGWPPFEVIFSGRNEVRVRNPNTFDVLVGVRSGSKGLDFSVPAAGVQSIYVPDGRYDIYFNYSNQPEAVFQGDGFSLAANGIEIRIVQIVDGNYGIRRVR